MRHASSAVPHASVLPRCAAVKSPNLLVDKDWNVKVAGERLLVLHTFATCVCFQRVLLRMCATSSAVAPIAATTAATTAAATAAAAADGMQALLLHCAPPRLQPVQAAGGGTAREQPGQRSRHQPHLAGGWLLRAVGRVTQAGRLGASCSLCRV